MSVLAPAHEQGVGVIARECLANGLLVKDIAALDVKTYTQSEDEATAKARQIELYRKAAAETGCTLAQFALQFVSRLEGVSVSLIGVSSKQQLDSLLKNAFPSRAGQELRAIPHFE